MKPGGLTHPKAYYIEIQRRDSQWGTGGGELPWFTPDGGMQWAELNAEVEGRLYQICDTVPGTKVYYEFYHGARAIWYTDNEDVMDFRLRGVDNNGNYTPGEYKIPCKDSYTKEATTYKWGHYVGSYVIPTGQTKTEFSFESVSTTSGDQSVGNLLDAVRFYTNSYMDLTLSNNAANNKAKAGDLVTYTIVAKNIAFHLRERRVIADDDLRLDAPQHQIVRSVTST